MRMQVDDNDAADAQTPDLPTQPPIDAQVLEPTTTPPQEEVQPDQNDLEMELDEKQIAKEALMAEVSQGLQGAKPDRAVVAEILLALEAQNPTSSPATSELLNGKWKVLYSTARSPSLKALTTLLKSAKQLPKSPSGADLVDVQDSFVTIKADQPRVESSLRSRVLSFENTVKLRCKLEAESAVRLVETYDSVESEYMNWKLPFQAPAQFKRSILVSYLDDEVLVIRDTLGRPDVLTRCSDATEPGWAPSSIDAPESTDEEVPGAS